jgi:hypothetical protein
LSRSPEPGCDRREILLVAVLILNSDRRFEEEASDEEPV